LPTNIVFLGLTKSAQHDQPASKTRRNHNEPRLQFQNGNESNQTQSEILRRANYDLACKNQFSCSFLEQELRILVAASER
jgi:hypothetical protein